MELAYRSCRLTCKCIRRTDAISCMQSECKFLPHHRASTGLLYYIALLNTAVIRPCGYGYVEYVEGFPDFQMGNQPVASCSSLT